MTTTTAARLLIAGLSLPPSVNAMYRRTARGVALTRAAERFRRDTVYIARDARTALIEASKIASPATQKDVMRQLGMQHT